MKYLQTKILTYDNWFTEKQLYTIDHTTYWQNFKDTKRTLSP